MPRPKRSKVAPSAPISLHHHRVGQPAVTASAVQKQKETFSPASSGRVTTGSDDSDGLVVAKRTARKGKNAATQEYVMSGALAPEDIGATRLRPPSGQTRAALTRITREAEHAQAEGAARARRVAARAPATEPDQIPSSMPEVHIAAGKAAHGSRESSARQSFQAGLGSRIQENPRLQSSMLGGATFKKRPRQPSLLQMVQSQNQKQDDLEDDDMYNFLPDDESTPLIKSLSQSHAHPKSSSSRQTSGSRKRKQATPEVQVPASQSQSTVPHSSPSTVLSQSPEQEDLYDLPAEEDVPEPTLPRHRSTQTPQLQIFSDTLAPPQSSSPAEPKSKNTHSKPVKAPANAGSRAQARKPRLPSAPLPPSSISSQTSPVRPAQSKPLTTAILQNLLPRRRIRPNPKGDYDIPSSSDVELDTTGLGEDEDELSFHAIKVRRKNSGMSLQKSATKRKANTAKKGSKTYTRKSIVESQGEDDENGIGSEGEEEEDNHARAGTKKIPALDGKAKAEMKRLADKFREVDEYTLDFEDMTGSSSQMKDAR